MIIDRIKETPRILGVSSLLKVFPEIEVDTLLPIPYYTPVGGWLVTRNLETGD